MRGLRRQRMHGQISLARGRVADEKRVSQTRVKAQYQRGMKLWSLTKESHSWVPSDIAVLVL